MVERSLDDVMSRHESTQNEDGGSLVVMAQGENHSSPRIPR